MPLVVLGDVVIGVLLQVAELPRLLDPRRHLGAPGSLELLELCTEGDDALRRDRLGVGRSVAHCMSGDGGIRVSPVTSGISIAKLSAKHQDHSSPGSSERISGWPVSFAWALAWRFGARSPRPPLPRPPRVRRCSRGTPAAR